MYNGNKNVAATEHNNMEIISASSENENDRFFDLFSAHYEWFYGNIAVDQIVKVWYRALLDAGFKKKSKRDFKDTLKLLDIGCGTGCYINPWRKKGFTVYGIDSSPSMIALARTKNENNDYADTFCVADIRNIKESIVTRHKYDVLTSHFNFLNLFPKNELKSIFNNIYLLSKRGGFWITDYSLPENLPQECMESYDVGNSKLTKRGFWNKRLNCFEHICKLDEKTINPRERYWFHSHATLRNILQETGWKLEKCYQSKVINGKLALSTFLDETEHTVIIMKRCE